MNRISYCISYLLKITFLTFLALLVLGAKPKKPKVYVHRLIKTQIFEQASYWGRLEPVKVAHLHAPIEGVVQKIFVKVGQMVRKGQVLATIQKVEIGLKMNPLKIRSPLSGYFYQSKVTQGSLVQKSAPLFTVFDPNTFKLSIRVTPQDLVHLKVSQKSFIKIGEQVVEAIIDSLSPEIDLLTGTSLVELRFPNKKELHLRPGTAAQVDFEFNHHSGFLLDKSIVKKRGKKHFVRILNEHLKVQEIPVKLGITKRSGLEIITDQLKEGDQIIIKSSVEPLMDDQEVDLVVPDETAS